MTCTLHVAWDNRLAGYDFGPGHPMAPPRLRPGPRPAAPGVGRTPDIRNAVATARLLRPGRRLFHSALAEAHEARDQGPLPEGDKGRFRGLTA